jgi:hypothetical protein
MPTKTRPIEKFAAAVGKCSKEVRYINNIKIVHETDQV